MKKKLYYIWAVLVIGFMVFGVLLLMHTEIYVDEVPVANAPSKIIAQKLVKEVMEEKYAKAPDALINAKITYKRAKRAKYDKETSLDNLKRAIKVQVPCTIIVVNGEPLLGLPTKDNAGEFLIAVKDKYKLPGCEEPEIKENITIDNSAIDIDKFFKTVDEAINYISKGKSKLTVVVRKPFNKEVQVPQTTVKVSSKKIPFGKQKVISKGSPGKKNVTGYVVFENGKKVREETTYEEFTVQPVPKQIAIGI